MEKRRQELLKLLNDFVNSPECRVEVVDENSSCRHSHRYWEFMIPRRRREEPFRTAVIIPPQVRHRPMPVAVNNKGVSCQILPHHFICNFYRRTIASSVKSGALNSLLLHHLELFTSLVRSDMPVELIRSESSALIATFTFVLKEVWKNTVKPPPARTIGRAVQYIVTNAGNSELTVETVAETLGVGRIYLARLFRRELGLSARQFIVETRLNMAKELLEDGRYQIAYIAEMTGWGSSAYFINVFRKHFGITPAGYARCCHNGRVFSIASLRADITY